MILEIGRLRVKPKGGPSFEADVTRAAQLIARAHGFRGLQFYRGIERSDRYYMLVQWDTVDHHQAFRDSNDFPLWRDLLRPHFAEPAKVEHAEFVITLPGPPIEF
jgi:heme-degrading monooxygenase HmoA